MVGLNKNNDFLKNESFQYPEILQKEYPYFSIPFVLNWLQNSDAETIEDLHQFRLNNVLLSELKNNWQTNTEATNQELSDLINSKLNYQNDYYALQGITISDDLPTPNELSSINTTIVEDLTPEERSLLVQMSFEEWLKHITFKKEQLAEEEKEREELKNNWRKQKLAEAIEEESDDIPEEVFKMAVDSIEKEELVSESIAEVYVKQGKYQQAINIYKKLILSFPEKKVYFATKIDIIRNNYNL